MRLRVELQVRSCRQCCTLRSLCYPISTYVPHHLAYLPMSSSLPPQSSYAVPLYPIALHAPPLSHSFLHSTVKRHTGHQRRKQSSTASQRCAWCIKPDGFE